MTIPRFGRILAGDESSGPGMLSPIQPVLFPADPVQRPLGERMRGLALIANAACTETAGTVAREVAMAWWDASIMAAGGTPSRLPPPAPPPSRLDLPKAALAEAAALGRDLACLPVQEANALLGRLYTQALPNQHRNAMGVFYTPPALVHHLLNRAEFAGCVWQTGHVLDPACGAGAFLLQAAQRMLEALPNTDPAIALVNLASRLRGWEIDGVAAWLAQLSLEVLALPLAIASGRRLGPMTEVADTLAAFAASKGAWDLVMGNPPFGKVKDTPQLRMRFRRSLHGHPNLYGMFFDLAVHLAKPQGGVVAYLTPASFLAGQYFRNLRRLLHETAPPVTIDLVESRSDVFDDVLQEVVLSTSRRGQPPGPAECAAVHVTRSGMRIEPTGRFRLPAKPDEPWLLPRCRQDAALVARLRAMPTRLADWGYEVCTGPLVWNRHKTQLHNAPKQDCVPVIWAESVTPDGRFVLKASKRNHRPWFEPRDQNDPNVVRQACVLVQRTTAKEQQRRLIAAAMPATLVKRCNGVAVENHLNMIRPSTETPAAKVPQRVLAAFLRTGMADRVLRCISGSVAVSATELEAMPLPAPEAVMHAAREADFERAIDRLYGVEVA